MDGTNPEPTDWDVGMEDMTPDTDCPRSLEELARMYDIIFDTLADEGHSLSVDLDDYPVS